MTPKQEQFCQRLAETWNFDQNDSKLDDDDSDSDDLKPSTQTAPVRPLRIKANERMSKDRVLVVAAAYQFEQGVSAVLAPILADISGLDKALPTMTGLMHAWNEKQLKDVLEFKTDSVTDTARLTQSQDHIEDGGLLHSAFEVCKEPNANDLTAMSRALGVPREKIKEWFARQRARMQDVNRPAAWGSLALVRNTFEFEARVFARKVDAKAQQAQAVYASLGVVEDWDEDEEIDISDDSGPEPASDTDEYESDPLGS